MARRFSSKFKGNLGVFLSKKGVRKRGENGTKKRTLILTEQCFRKEAQAQTGLHFEKKRNLFFSAKGRRSRDILE